MAIPLDEQIQRKKTFSQNRCRDALGIDMQVLNGLMVPLSDFCVKWAPQIASKDLNPVICSAERRNGADARMTLISKNHMKSNT
jgi:hypothetical protein